MRRSILTVIVAAVILFAIAAAGAVVLVLTHEGTDFFSQQILGIRIL